jgi:hypothetical protein
MYTTKLNNGVEVVARPMGPCRLYAVTYVNRTQAEKAAAKIGGEVYQPRPGSIPFYVIPPKA